VSFTKILLVVAENGFPVPTYPPNSVIIVGLVSSYINEKQTLQKFKKAINTN